jgi:transcription antitermination factor NusG
MSGSYGSSHAGAVPGGQERNASEVATFQWFAVRTRYRFEKKVAALMSQKNLQVYLPLLTERHTWSDRQTNVTVPLFPGYAFVHIDQSTALRQAVMHTPGFCGFVSFGGIIVPVPPPQIEHLRLLLQQSVPFSLHPFIHVGRRVRVRGGCLDGLEGVLLQNQERKLVVSLESIQRSLAIDLQGYELDLV